MSLNHENCVNVCVKEVEWERKQVCIRLDELEPYRLCVCECLGEEERDNEREKKREKVLPWQLDDLPDGGEGIGPGPRLDELDPI